MSSFEELVGDPAHLKHCASLGYWLGTIKSSVPPGELEVSQLALEMTVMYDSEDYVFGEEYAELGGVMAEFTPIAPVTLTRKWCPLDVALQWMGKPIWQQIEPGESLKAAAALWPQPDEYPLDDVIASSEDEAHFLFLLGMTCYRALERAENILLVCRPGWSFDYSATNPLGIFGYSALSAGRLYPERIPSGSIKSGS